MNYNKQQAETDSLCQSFVYKPHILRVTTSSNALTASLNSGRYRVTSDIDCFVSQGAAGALSANASIDSPLYAGTYDYFVVTGTDDSNVAVVSASGAGYLYMTRQQGQR